MRLPSMVYCKCLDSGFRRRSAFFIALARRHARPNCICVGGRNASCSEDAPVFETDCLGNGRREQEASLHFRTLERAS